MVNGLTLLDALQKYPGGCQEIATMEYITTCPFTTTVPTSIKNRDVTIAPNPVNDILNIYDLDGQNTCTVEIYDALGRCCISTRVDAKNSHIAVGHLPAGVYFVRARYLGGMQIVKIIKL